MIIHSIYRDYETSINNSFEFVDELADMDNTFVVIDSNIKKLYEVQLAPLIDRDSVFVLEAIEKNKTVYKALEITDELVKMKSKRDTKLIAIGGGIVQDVCCFIATVLYRGISWYFIPTTLLAQADSCIGSKSSINYKKFKNLIGTFYPPAAIWVNMQFMDTLVEKEYFSGLGEVIKCSIMLGKTSFYESLGRMNAILKRDYEVLSLETQKALAFKKSVIEVDEFDKGYRNIMNFGHTFGHAIESSSEFLVPHGQGVSCGIMIANELSVARGLLSEKYRDDIRETLLRIINIELINPEFIEFGRLLSYMRKDKKYQGDRNTYILASENSINKYNDVTDEEVESALHKFSFVLTV